jgi:hypothetical protein
MAAYAPSSARQVNHLVRMSSIEDHGSGDELTVTLGARAWRAVIPHQEMPRLEASRLDPPARLAGLAGALLSTCNVPVDLTLEPRPDGAHAPVFDYGGPNLPAPVPILRPRPVNATNCCTPTGPLAFSIDFECPR